MSNIQYFFACLGVGVALAAFKILYGFFPIFLFIDSGVFLIAAGLAAGIRPKKFWRWSLALAAPAVFLNLIFLRMNGLEALKQGVGFAAAWSGLAILVCSLFGGWVVSTIARRLQIA